MKGSRPVSREGFERYLDEAPLLAWISDEGGRTLWANAKLRAARAEDRPPARETSRDERPPMLPEACLDSDRQVLESGEPFEGRHEGVGPRGEASVLLVRKFRLRGPRGARLVGGFAVDITSQSDSERRPQASDDRFSRMVARARDGVWLVDDQWRTTFVNPALERMLGFTAAEMRGRTVLEFVPDDARDEVLARMRDREGGLDAEVEGPLRRKDGTICWTLSSTHPIVDARDAFAGAFALVTDITERKRATETEAAMEATLRETQRLESLGVLAGGIAHDFNNLVTGVLANLDLVALDLPPSADGARESLQLAKDAARRAAPLTRQLLAYAGKNRLSVRSTDLVSVIRSTHDILGKGRLRVELALADVPPVVADQAELSQVVLNLMVNAVEALGDGPGQARVETGVRTADRAFLSECRVGAALAEGTYGFMVVADEGCGMSPETASRAFEPFFSTKGIGRGLGLAATIGIVRGHGGALHVKTAPGSGTTVTLLLPIAAAREDSVVPPAPVVTARSEAAPRTLLVVDDDDGVRRAARRLLEASGYRAIEAAGGREAVAIFTERRAEIDVVLLDLRMPEMDGEETLRRLRDIEPDVRVVLWSGYAEPELVRRVTSAQGVAGFVSKPFEAGVLLRAVSLAAPRKS